MKRKCLTYTGQGPTSRTLTYLCNASERSNALAEYRMPTIRAYICLFLKHEEQKAILRSRNPVVQIVPIQPLHPINSVSSHCDQLLKSPSHSHCADGGKAMLLETNTLGQPPHRCPSAPGKLQSSTSSCSLSTEWEGRHWEIGCSKERQRQSEGLLFLSTPEMMLYEFTDLTHFKRTTRNLNEVCTPKSSPKRDIQCPVTIATFLSRCRTNQISDNLHYCNCENKMDKITIDTLFFFKCLKPKQNK